MRSSFFYIYIQMQTDKIKIGIQGYAGSFHDEAARKYWPNQNIEIIPADSFDILGSMLRDGHVDKAIMAIENSIAGTILQNYRILRENQFWVNGEVYLRIKHNLLGIHGATIQDIKSIASHPMAIHQCRQFLDTLPKYIKVIDSEDTALSAQRISEKQKKSQACIASSHAGQLYGLKVLSEGIETHKTNYTRFFVVNRQRCVSELPVNKASVYLKIADQKGQLLKVLKVIQEHNLNMSKLQSFPVLGHFREYFFHLDIEFEDVSHFYGLREDLKNLTTEYDELGFYARADMHVVFDSNHHKNT